ncbi:DsbE family thiol:disulfide interchange protein [Aureimonas flava]|uniref:DsbE family thiol:disulfide interchange protein n=1 Tax=Aureimonas flava TaxID=2320271 RepID=A0A3A1WKE9_9HYPH|nr:DsbE family thiol:disulfide interchange protein [Aureimonas flava]RIY01096.1 DsbE family thiol:disulfide interchange protein [Aureimonas flava]
MLPVVIFAGLAGVFLFQLLSGHDPQVLPSALIGKPAPETRLPALAGLVNASGAPVPGLDLVPGDGRTRLVNVFASWCVPCRQEHPALMALSQDPRFDIVAINYKDKPANALGFLRELGNPFDAVGTDEPGRSTIDWGVYGVPETFLVGPDGTILWKGTGPLTRESVEAGLLPALARIAPPNS